MTMGLFCPFDPPARRRIRAAPALVSGALALAIGPGRAEEGVGADTALVLAVDVSESVDDNRYRLQMEGIARALEDPGVIDAITGGYKGAILLTLVTWADAAETALPWQLIRSAEEARRVAALVRTLPHRRGEYTCMARMIATVSARILDSAPASAARRVLDVSGDGIDNCAEPEATEHARDELVGKGVTINGLPIIVKGENDIVGAGAYRAPGFGLRELPKGPDTDKTTLDAWYGSHVIGGPSAFLQVALGYEDFGRAFRQKFVVEISARE
jgi:uncharacterized protein DUF1194